MRQIKLGPLHRRPIQWFLQANWNQSKDNWETFVRLEKKIIPHLLWWCEKKSRTQGVPLTLFKADVSLYTDVSQWGYGATLGDKEISVQWTPEEANMHSNNLRVISSDKSYQDISKTTEGEMFINLLGQHHNHSFNKQTGRHKIMEHNKNGLGSVDSVGQNKLYSSSSSHSRNIECESRLVIKKKSSDPIRMVNSKGYTNTHMDKLGNTEHRSICHMSELQNSNISITSARSEGMASKCNDLQLDRIEPIYAFPPWKLIGEVLMNLEEDQGNMILIAPKWEARPWYPILLDLLIADPIPLLKISDLLIQPQTGIRCKELDLLNLHAWRLSSIAQHKKDLVKR